MKKNIYNILIEIEIKLCSFMLLLFFTTYLLCGKSNLISKIVLSAWEICVWRGISEVAV